MDIVVSQEQGRVPVTVFQIRDRINLGNAFELEQEASKAFEQGMRDLVIELGDVPSLTSVGLRSLLFIYKLLEGVAPEASSEALKSPHLKLARPTPFVLQVLKTAGFDRFFEIYDHLPDAVASF